MTKLTILRGISGCGKSTWARQQNATVVSRDDIRHFILGIPAEDYYKVDSDVLRAREQRVSVIQDAMIGGLLRAGQDVIVDNTNIEWKFVKALAKIGYRHGADVEIKVFEVPAITAIMRDKFRAQEGGRSVGEAVIRKQNDRFQGTKNNTLDPITVPRPYNGTPGKPKAFMYDLDGTVYHMNDKRGPYAHNVDVDDPDLVVQEIVRTLSLDLVPIAMSGRKAATRELTEHCLKRDGVPFDHLFMRADEDNRADNLVKLDLFNEHVRDNYDVQFVLDDRNQVVDMWRLIGLKCLQVQEGDF